MVASVPVLWCVKVRAGGILSSEDSIRRTTPTKLGDTQHRRAISRSAHAAQKKAPHEAGRSIGQGRECFRFGRLPGVYAPRRNFDRLHKQCVLSCGVVPVVFIPFFAPVLFGVTVPGVVCCGADKVGG